MAERLGLAQRVIWVSGLDPSAENFLFQTCEAAYLTVLSAEKLRRTIGRCVLLVPEGAEFSALGVTHPAILPVGRQDIDVIAQQLRSALRDRDAILTREQDQSQALGDVGNASATSLSYQGVLAEVLTELWRTGGETVGQPSGHPGIAAS